MLDPLDVNPPRWYPGGRITINHLNTCHFDEMMYDVEAELLDAQMAKSEFEFVVTKHLTDGRMFCSALQDKAVACGVCKRWSYGNDSLALWHLQLRMNRMDGEL